MLLEARGEEAAASHVQKQRSRRLVLSPGQGSLWMRIFSLRRGFEKGGVDSGQSVGCNSEGHRAANGLSTDWEESERAETGRLRGRMGISLAN